MPKIQHITWCAFLLLPLFTVSVDTVYPPANRTVMQFMLQPNTYTPRSLDCFVYYIPEINAILALYHRNYADCVDRAEEQRCFADLATENERVEIEERIAAACNALSECDEYFRALDYFACARTSSLDMAKQMHNISILSEDILMRVSEIYGRIAAEEEWCLISAERVYTVHTAIIYEALQDCLEGKTPVP